ncbi:ABC transporter permease [Morganella sp. Je.2.23]|uniref:ABC transporter permease n=1 Tax=Morganella sp. Je.2.23 TaxID=3142840 RepID=UPI003DA7BEAB
MSTLIEVQNVTRRYTNGGQTLTVLNTVSLSISAGEFVAITGASGSGKSTLMNIMGCLDTPDNGHYLLDGRDTARMSPDELAALRREHIGFVFQRYHLMSDMTAAANVEVPAIYAGIRRHERREKALNLLMRLGLTGREHHKPGELSGGQQQRVCIARALMNGGEIILADEPTGALDSVSGREVLATLSELNQRGHTIIMVTHDSQVAKHAGRIIELQDGAVLSDSGPATSAGTPFLPKAMPPAGFWQRTADRIRASFLMALKSMNSHRLRTALTMSGIIFGIAAVVTVVALGEGAKQKTLENIRSLGANLITIFPGQDFYISREERGRLVPADYRMLTKLPDVDSVSPEIDDQQKVQVKGKSLDANVNGVGSDYFHMNNFTLIRGRIFRDSDRPLQEGIIDQKSENILFGDSNESPLGKIIIVGRVPIKIVGVVNNTRDYGSVNIWVPYRTMMYRVTGKLSFTRIIVHIRESSDSNTAANNVRNALIRQHGKKDFIMWNQDKYRRSAQNTSFILNLMILSIAAVALMIGSLGVMNIMLVSVTERTHEIGIRMAVGARRRDIMQQFMLEAVLICLGGGVLGIALSLITSMLFSQPGNTLVAVYSWEVAGIAFVCSTIIGMIFGWLPAGKAARMNPVAALAGE